MLAPGAEKTVLVAEGSSETIQESWGSVGLQRTSYDWKGDTDESLKIRKLEDTLYVHGTNSKRLLQIRDNWTIFDDEPMHKDDQDDTDDLDQERDLLASLIQKLKCEIDLKKFVRKLDKYNDVNYMSKVEIDCAKAKGDLMIVFQYSGRILNNIPISNFPNGEKQHRLKHGYGIREISHERQCSTPEQNGIVERRNRTLVEVLRNNVKAAKVPCSSGLKHNCNAFFTQTIHLDESKAYRVFNKRTRIIVETIHVNFDELPQMASDHVSSDPGP
ncbi:hypothetical protein Tco_0702745 [Tanacetum coccineum]|uniref:Integrase catalytic domain-containing protein n=1 Tax=Tanacetum coccineum TaxID=301880 RepID=A0ABQ4XWW6_9ASTR